MDDYIADHFDDNFDNSDDYWDDYFHKIRLEPLPWNYFLNINLEVEITGSREMFSQMVATWPVRRGLGGIFKYYSTASKSFTASSIDC